MRRFFSQVMVFFSRIHGFFKESQSLHHARFASLYELTALLTTSQLLTWPHSVVVNDVKGELFAATAGWRSKLGKVYVIDPTGVGHRYDPTAGKYTDLELKAIAKGLLFKPEETDEIFTQRGIRMLTPIFHAAAREQMPLLPYAAHLINEP